MGKPSANTETAQSAPSPPSDTPKAASKGVSGGRIFVSPYAKKLAAEMGIALDSVGTATGTNGRIVAADIIKASQQKPIATKLDKVDVPKPVTITGDRT